MELIEWSRLIAPLLLGLYLSVMSELLSASSKSISTPEGAYIQSTRKYLGKSLKILVIPPLLGKNSDRPHLGLDSFYAAGFFLLHNVEHFYLHWG